MAKIKPKKVSKTDPESGWFHKGEHKSVFAYSIQTACDKNGFVTSFSVHKGNEHDSRTFKVLYDRIKEEKNNEELEKIVADAGYKTPAIAKLLIDDNIEPFLPYKRPMTKKGYFKKSEFVYDEYFDCYICHNNEILKYATTNREGYREYKSDKNKCKNCKHLKMCTNSKDNTKVVYRHIWEEYIEKCEDIRHRGDYKEIYSRRKETIERVFGTAKEYHSMRYTRTIGKQKIELQVGLTFACLNLMKLTKIMDKNGWIHPKYLYMSFKNYLKYLFKEYFNIITSKNPIEKFSIGFLSTN